MAVRRRAAWSLDEMIIRQSSVQGTIINHIMSDISEGINTQKIRAGYIKTTEFISSENYVAGTTGWKIDGDGDAEFNNVVVRGDYESGNWNGASPADLSIRDSTATAGIYLDSSVGSAQFEGDIFLGGTLWLRASGSEVIDFGEGFDMKVYKDNPTAGEDTFWIRHTAGTDGIDHFVVGPSAGADYLQAIRLRADRVRLEGDGINPRFGVESSADGGNFIFKDLAGDSILIYDEVTDNQWEMNKKLSLAGVAAGASSIKMNLGEGYFIYTDNTGSGTDLSRLWIDTPDQGEVIIGPRTGADTLDRIRLRADEIIFNWESGANQGTWTGPRGLIFDHGTVTTSAGGTLATYPANITGLNTTATVPANISVTIFVWAWMRFDMTLDMEFAALDVTVGGTAPLNPSLIEQDLTTDTDATAGGTGVDISGTTSVDGTHTHPGESLSGTHSHQSGTLAVNGNHTHSHSHSMAANQWKTLSYFGARSFTPTGSTVTLQARGGSAAGSNQIYDDGALVYLVVIN